MANLTIGQRIASQRKQIGLSQEALAERLEVSRQAVSKWESDQTLPEIEKLVLLSKLFEVNVGWLLGVENDPLSPAGFTDEQFSTIELIIAKYHPPKKHKLLRYISIFAVISVIIGIITWFALEIRNMDHREMQSAERIEALTQNNQLLSQQLSSVQDALEQQTKTGRLLAALKMEGYVADNNFEYINHVLYLQPNVYLENNKAYIRVSNPITGYHDRVECIWDSVNGHYVARFQAPATDGSQYTFLLVNDYGYEQEDLVLRDIGFSYMGTYCGFHLETDTEQFMNMKMEKPYIREPGDQAYSFCQAIHTPHIFHESVVAYKDIQIRLYHNDKVLWEESFLDDFKKATGGLGVNAKRTAVYPDISLQLPGLKSGDTLKLILTAQTVNGGKPEQHYETLLDYWVVSD